MKPAILFPIFRWDLEIKRLSIKPAKPGAEPISSEMKSRAVTDSVEAPYSRAGGIWISSADLCISSETF